MHIGQPSADCDNEGRYAGSPHSSRAVGYRLSFVQRRPGGHGGHWWWHCRLVVACKQDMARGGGKWTRTQDLLSLVRGWVCCILLRLRVAGDLAKVVNLPYVYCGIPSFEPEFPQMASLLPSGVIQSCLEIHGWLMVRWRRHPRRRA